MTNSLPRWVRAATGRAHLDLGERTSHLVRTGSQEVIVTACRVHLDAAAEVVGNDFEPRCSNCVSLARRRPTT
jgi:hypothetical protein